MPKIPIFICHSSKTVDAAKYRDAVHDALKDHPRFAPWVDKTGLEPGDDWYEAIFQQLTTVRGAVVLVGKHALQSDFVPIELSVLLARRYASDLPLFTVWIDDVKPEQLKKGLIGNLRLDHIQGIVGLDAVAAAQRVVQSLDSKFPPRDPRTPEEVAQANVLRAVKDSELSLDDVADAIRDRPWDTENDWREALVSMLFEADFADACYMLRSLADVAPVATPALAAALTILAPRWLRDDEVPTVARLALKPDAERCFSLDCTRGWTLRSLIARTFARPLGHRPHVCELGPPEHEDPIEDLLEQVLRHFNRQWKRPPSADRMKRDIADLKARLRKRYNEGEPVFLAVDGDWASAELVTGLQAELETIVIGLFDRAHGARPASASVFSLDAQRSSDAYNDYMLAQEDLCPQQGG